MPFRIIMTSIITIFVLSASNAEQIIVIENWRPCSIGNNYDKDIPEWAKSKELAPYYGGNTRSLAIHGLCNEKFKRVVLCDPDMDDLDPSKKNSAYNVCRKYFTNLK
jgi:hypothetical protein